MAQLFLILFILYKTEGTNDKDLTHMERTEACNSLKCDDTSDLTVCGVRYEKTGMSFKVFANECALLKYGCSMDKKDAYGLIDMEHCKRSVDIDTGEYNARNIGQDVKLILKRDSHSDNNQINCNDTCKHLEQHSLCGIRQDGEGYRVKLFDNECELLKYNCQTTLPFIKTDMFICGDTLPDRRSLGSKINNSVDHINSIQNYKNAFENSKRIIVIDGSMLGQVKDVNETIENFFAATHVLDLPIRELNKNEINTRRMLLKNAGPIKVFKPWITIPKKIKTDYFHEPTLSTCYHKCPMHCPDTYSPVCGVPGILAREPSLMFQNHCYMDVAQCKMYWENSSSTAVSSSYIESSFLFCLGDQLNGLYRFLPLVRSLQHMGRLKKKGKFHYRLNNMRFFNNYAYKEPKLMG